MFREPLTEMIAGSRSTQKKQESALIDDSGCLRCGATHPFRLYRSARLLFAPFPLLPEERGGAHLQQPSFSEYTESNASPSKLHASRMQREYTSSECCLNVKKHNSHQNTLRMRIYHD